MEMFDLYIMLYITYSTFFNRHIDVLCGKSKNMYVALYAPIRFTSYQFFQVILI